MHRHMQRKQSDLGRAVEGDLGAAVARDAITQHRIHQARGNACDEQRRNGDDENHKDEAYDFQRGLHRPRLELLRRNAGRTSGPILTFAFLFSSAVANVRIKGPLANIYC